MLRGIWLERRLRLWVLVGSEGMHQGYWENDVLVGLGGIVGCDATRLRAPSRVHRRHVEWGAKL